MCTTYYVIFRPTFIHVYIYITFSEVILAVFTCLKYNLQSKNVHNNVGGIHMCNLGLLCTTYSVIFCTTYIFFTFSTVMLAVFTCLKYHFQSKNVLNGVG